MHSFIHTFFNMVAYFKWFFKKWLLWGNTVIQFAALFAHFMQAYLYFTSNFVKKKNNQISIFGFG